MCGSIWRPDIAAAKPNWPDFGVFLTGPSLLQNQPKITVFGYLFGQWPSRPIVPQYYSF
jgi:hypothetical protein